MADDVTLLQARNAIQDRWTAQWVTGTGGALTPFTFENEKSVPPAAMAAAAFTTAVGAWVRLVVRSTVSRQETLGPAGARKYERQGDIHLQVFVPVDRGTADADTLAGQARAIFEGAKFSGLRCYAGAPKEVGPDGRWYQVNVVIPFTYYETL